MLGRSLWIGLLLVALPGCGVQEGWLYTCDHPDKGHKGPSGLPDPCHYEDPRDPYCAIGEYAHWRLNWQQPTLLWIGAQDQAPECPFGPTSISYEGHTDLVAPVVCEACTCEPPAGSCALPSTLTASTTACSMPGGSTTSFNAPTPWDGSCDSTTQTPSGAAHSLTIDPIKMTETGCASGPPIAAKVVSLHWETFALGCDVRLPPGPVTRSTCISEPIPAGFKECIVFDGESDCPSEEPGEVFTEQHVFYNGVRDERQCSECACGAPTGSACKAQMSIYEGNDLTCSGPALMSYPISSAGPTCIDVQLPGQSLGSKSAGPMTYLPGTCPPMGGVGTGTATPIGPTTFCCLP